jgi:hypothetical protein
VSKLIIVACILLIIYVLIRRISIRNEFTYRAPGAPPDKYPGTTIPGEARVVEGERQMSVVRQYFRDTDAEHGPPDPTVFYDELFIDLRDNTGQIWHNSMHVATPRGISKAMDDEGWDSVVGTELIIVKRYDLRTIIDAAVHHLDELYETHLKVAGRFEQSGGERIG